jgi:hypothetical protein
MDPDGPNTAYNALILLGFLGRKRGDSGGSTAPLAETEGFEPSIRLYSV